MSRDWIKDARTLLQERYDQLCPGQSPLNITPSLDESEAKFFILGLERGIFSVDEQGYVESKVLPKPLGKNPKSKVINLFWKKTNPVFREGVCQLATAASLVLKYGWNVEEITLEPGKKSGGPAYGIDISIRDAQGQHLVCGEVKSDSNKLQLLLNALRHCCASGSHTKDQCEFRRDHAKFDFLLKVTPLYFFATAPGREVSFKVREENDQIALGDEADSLISRTDVLGLT
jgi:hypothetical protein